jgi:D-amino-acid dehydrogenase
VLRELALASAGLHAQLHADGLATGFARKGLLNVYADAKALRAARAAASADGSDGLPAQPLDGPALRELFPGLAGDPAGAVLYAHEAHCDPLRFVQAVADEARGAGVDIRTGVEVLGLRREGERVTSLWTTAGEITAGQIVIAAGVWSARLARELGVRVPVLAGKGYHVDLAADASDPKLPVWFHDQRVVVTPLDRRTRVAGTLQLTGVDERVDARRVDAVLAAAQSGLNGFRTRAVREVWRGLRPCTPDGLPIIGRPDRAGNVILATGHGMWGLQLAPVTGRLVAQLASDRRPDFDLGPLQPDRFGLARRRREAARR